MKKSLRILSLVLAVVMIFGTMSVMGSAYSAYKGDGVTLQYDDVDIPSFSVDQYASMALDEVDRMLADAQINVDIYIGKLNLSSIDGTVASINELLDQVSGLVTSGVLGHAQKLVDAVNNSIANTSRANGDLQVIWDVLDLIGELRGRDNILYLYVTGNLDVGALQGFVKSYMFDIRELVVGLVYQLTGLGDTLDEDGNVVEEYSYMDDRNASHKLDSYIATGGPIVLLQELLNKYVLGEWKKLDDLFYSETNTTSNVVYSEYEFHDGSASGALVTDATPNTAAYDYYGYVHPDRWVTQTLGDAIRVPEGAAKPNASYSHVNLVGMGSTYEFVEPLLVYAYNNIAVPVLNRITKRWLREKAGYYFDPAKSEEFITDADGNSVPNPTFDYMYMGEEVEGAEVSDRIFEIFDVDEFEIPKLSLGANDLFIPNLNRQATLIIPRILKANYTVKRNGSVIATNTVPTLQDGDVLNFVWNGTTSTGGTASYNFDWKYGDNDEITQNAVNLVKFLLQVTEEEFFSDVVIRKGEYKAPEEVAGMGNQELLAYILRSVINANVDTMWIPENDNTKTIAGVGYEAVVQLAYQDIPQFTYTRPASGSSSDLVNKALAILMDVAAYKLNAELDTNPASGSGLVNNGSTNNTGLLGYLGDSGSYGTTAATIAKWAVKTYTETSYGNILAGVTSQLMSSATENSLWNDLDTVLNAIIPIKTVSGASIEAPDNRPWIAAEIANNSQVVKTVIFNYLLYPIVDLQLGDIFTLLDRNNAGALAFDTFEVAIVDTLHRVFDLLFPKVFAPGINTLDGVLNNGLLAGMLSDLACTLSATGSYDSLNGNGTITGRGKTIAEFALPIVCMILGLSDSQEFKELENYVPDVIPSDKSSAKFLVYNASKGVNTSYKDQSLDRKYDKLYTYDITAYSAKKVGGNAVSISGLSGANAKIPAGGKKEVTLSGYSAGDMIEIVIEYRILDENGEALNNGAVLSSRKYTYVGAAEGDDEKLESNAIGSASILAPTDVYLSGGLSSLENFAFRFKDNDSGSQRDVTVTNVSVTAGPSNAQWVLRSSSEDAYRQTVKGQEGTYVFTPFKVDDPAYKYSYKYAEDEDGKVIYDETTGLPTITGTADLPDVQGAYYVPFGTYTVSATFNDSGASKTVTTRVHVYNDWGLPSLVNNAIAANRSDASLDSVGKNYFADYLNALTTAAAFVLKPFVNGQNFDTDVNLTTGNNTNGNYNNNYAALYAALYEQIERIKPHAVGSDGASMWETVNTAFPYNYSRASASFDGTTAAYRDYLEYYETGYSFIGQRNYVGHTYKAFKKAVNAANDLIYRELKFINGDPETWEDLSAADRANRVAEYQSAVENTEVIGSVEAAYALHRVALTKDRLLSLPADNNSTSKLQLVLNNSLFNITSGDGYSPASWEAYSRAKAFAQATLNDGMTSLPEKINTAMNEYIKAWRGLEGVADYTELRNAISTAKSFITSNSLPGLNPRNQKVLTPTSQYAGNQTKYTVESYTELLEALLAADAYIDDYTAGNVLGKSEQHLLDAAAERIVNAQNNLVEAGGGDNPPVTEDPVVELLDEDGILNVIGDYIYDEMWEIGYVPRIDEDFVDIMGYYEIGDGDYAGTPIDGVLYGVPMAFGEDDIVSLFNVENAEARVLENPYGQFGTGSVIMFEDLDGNALKAYVIAIRGDTNGDGIMSPDDITPMEYNNLGVDGYYYDDGIDNCMLAGFDCDGDGAILPDDISVLDYYHSMYIDFGQAYGSLYDY